MLECQADRRFFFWFKEDETKMSKILSMIITIGKKCIMSYNLHSNSKKINTEKTSVKNLYLVNWLPCI